MSLEFYKIKLEDGFNLLLESGDFLLLEQAVFCENVTISEEVMLSMANSLNAIGIDSVVITDSNIIESFRFSPASSKPIGKTRVFSSTGNMSRGSSTTDSQPVGKTRVFRPVENIGRGSSTMNNNPVGKTRNVGPNNGRVSGFF